jgi:hypothetical protein
MFKNIFANTFSKTEKIIISISLIVPAALEIVLLSLFNSYFLQEGNWEKLRAIIFIQFSFLFFSFLFFSFLRKKIVNKMVRWITILLLLLLSVYLLLTWGISGITIGW